MMDWIKCSDSLPENNEYVLCSDERDIYILKFMQEQDKRKKNPRYWFESPSGEDFFDEITHWMPLPYLPKEE
jgi:hypothetical protein